MSDYYCCTSVPFLTADTLTGIMSTGCACEGWQEEKEKKLGAGSGKMDTLAGEKTPLWSTAVAKVTERRRKNEEARKLIDPCLVGEAKKARLSAWPIRAELFQPSLQTNFHHALSLALQCSVFVYGLVVHTVATMYPLSLHLSCVQQVCLSVRGVQDHDCPLVQTMRESSLWSHRAPL